MPMVHTLMVLPIVIWIMRDHSRAAALGLFEQMRGEAVPQRVQRVWLVDLGPSAPRHGSCG
jgi:hypothetical protein